MNHCCCLPGHVIRKLLEFLRRWQMRWDSFGGHIVDEQSIAWSDIKLKGRIFPQVPPGQSTGQHSHCLSCSLIRSELVFIVQCKLLQLCKAFLMTVTARRLVPVPMGVLQVEQVSLSTWLFCHFFKQRAHTKWPRGQQGTGPSLGSVMQIEHSTIFCSQLLNLLVQLRQSFLQNLTISFIDIFYCPLSRPLSAATGRTIPDWSPALCQTLDMIWRTWESSHDSGMTRNSQLTWLHKHMCI